MGRECWSGLRGCGWRGVAKGLGSPHCDRLSSSLSRVIEGSMGVARQTRSNSLILRPASKNFLSSHLFFFILFSFFLLHERLLRFFFLSLFHVLIRLKKMPLPLFPPPLPQYCINLSSFSFFSSYYSFF